MNNSWLVRPFPHDIRRLDEFKQNNIVAIGWPNIGDLTGKSREDIKSILSGNPYNLTALKLGNAYATVDLFVNRMSIGDLVLVPDGDDIYFAKITSDYFLDTSLDNNTAGYPHQRTVEWLTTVLRTDLSKELRSSLKVHRTTADLSKHYDEIQTLSTGNTYVSNNVEIETVEVSYPLRPNLNVTFKIPSNMTKEEATRLSLYFNTLYFSE